MLHPPHLPQNPILLRHGYAPVKLVLLGVYVNHRRFQLLVPGKPTRQNDIPIILLRKIGYGIVSKAVACKAMEKLWCLAIC